MSDDHSIASCVISCLFVSGWSLPLDRDRAVSSSVGESHCAGESVHYTNSEPLTSTDISTTPGNNYGVIN